MTKVDKDEIERLINLSVADMVDKASCERIINTYIDAGYKFCKTCDPAIRLAFKKLKIWWSGQNTKQYQFIKPL